MDIIMDCSSYQ